MAVIALTSARGAPGVTTTALALALAWERPVVLVEADVSGSSAVLAGYLRGSVRHDRGLVDLALAQRRADLVGGFHAACLPLPGSGARLLPGLVSWSQAATMEPVWGPLSTVLHALEREGTDVVVDAGRLGTQHGPAAVLRSADAVLLVTRSTLPAVAATRTHAGVLREELSNQATGPHTLALLVVGEGQPYSAKEIREAIDTPVAACIAWDPVHAEVFSLGAQPGRRLETSALVRSVRAAITPVQQMVSEHRARLAPATPTRERTS